MKLNKKANMWFTILKYGLVLVLIFVIATSLHAKVPEYGEKIGGFLGLIEPEIDEDNNNPANRADPLFKDNVYAFLYLSGDVDSDGPTPEIFLTRSNLIKTFDNYKEIKEGICSMPKHFSSALSAEGCWIFVVEEDGGWNPDNCGNQIYNPLSRDFDYVLTSDSPSFAKVSNLDTGAELLKNSYCNPKYYCKKDGPFKLLSYFYYGGKYNQPIKEKFFKGDILCGAVLPGEYVWVKCDQELAKKMGTQNKNLDLFEKDFEPVISFTCECNGNSCLWSEVKDK